MSRCRSRNGGRAIPDFDVKDAALVGGGALLLYLLLGKRGDSAPIVDAPPATFGSLVRCRVFLRPDGSLRVNGKTATLADIARTCARRIEVSASGAAKQGDFDRLVRQLKRGGFQVVAR